MAGVDTGDFRRLIKNRLLVGVCVSVFCTYLQQIPEHSPTLIHIDV